MIINIFFFFAYLYIENKVGGNIKLGKKNKIKFIYIFKLYRKGLKRN